MTAPLPRFALAAASLGLCLGTACSPRPPAPPVPPAATAEAPPPSTEDEALDTLVRASTFEDVAIHYDAHLSSGVRAFRVVFAAPDAAERFRTIRARGTLVGQLYAAIGLRHHDPTAYAEAVRALRAHADERVAVQFGCLGSSERVGELLESDRDGAIRLVPGQTLAQWLELHHGGKADIVGGAFTSQFGEVASRL